MSVFTPRFWADGRREVKVEGVRRPVVLKRAGWSDLSQDDAAAHAARRLDDAELRLLSREPLERQERRVAYNGADGVPIREEVVETHGDAVITRNVYGALCLNVADVLFADVDVAEAPSETGSVKAVVGSVLATAFFAGLGGAWLAVPVAVIAAAITWSYTRRQQRLHDVVQRNRAGLEGWLSAHPDWRVRVYETPAGQRIAATHRRFVPTDPEVAAFFAAVHADPVYAKMCRFQICFRARVSAKPWRIGHHRMGSAVWPVTDPDRLRARVAWVNAYTAAAGSYAACRLVEELGAGVEDAGVAEVIATHDRLSGALGGLPIA
jgi:hypothetical protein